MPSKPNAEGAGFKGAGLIEMDETFFEHVYEQVRKVPSGSVCTYGTSPSLPGIRARRARWAMP